MGTDAARSLHLPLEQIRFGRDVLLYESRILAELARRLDLSFSRAAELLFACRGCVIVSGMGKAGIIGRKISASLASLGTPSHFLHPAEAVHGDLGRIRSEDVFLLLSAGGETEEVLRLLPILRSWHVPVIAMTCRAESTLAKQADVTLCLGDIEEAGHLRLAPSASTTAMLAVGDALALLLSKLRGFRAEDFARFHPGGSLGLRLSKVEDHMRPPAECRTASESATVREVVVATRRPGRRSGAVMLVDRSGRLTGLFTDSDLARILERRDEGTLDRPIADCMTKDPICVPAGTLMPDAVRILAERKISELPVVDADHRPVGMIDITDIIGLFPGHLRATEEESRSGPNRPSSRTRNNTRNNLIGTGDGEPRLIRISADDLGSGRPDGRRSDGGESGRDV
ncbi:MAG: KpsF/GutQ family sugar-phosphate isomerase [Thermogutta sp.]